MNKHLYFIAISIVINTLFIHVSNGQNTSLPYKLRFDPLLRYNSVDGVGLGVQMRGRYLTIDENSAHHLLVRFGFGTKFPDVPVWYSIQLDEPLYFWSAYGEPSYIRLYSSYKVGIHRHNMEFFKRWQDDFNDSNYIELTTSGGIEKLVNRSYRAYPNGWDPWLMGIFKTSLVWHKLYKKGFFQFNMNMFYGTYNNEGSHHFLTMENEFQLSYSISRFWVWQARIYMNNVFWGNPIKQYRPMIHDTKLIDRHENIIYQAKGTIPSAWVRDGLFQYGGGGGLRGYHTIMNNNLLTNAPIYYKSIYTLNTEFDFPNIIDYFISKMNLVGRLLHMRTYFFYDVGQASRRYDDTSSITDFFSNKILHDGGIGTMLYIKFAYDYGKFNTFSIRYEVPWWLSNPQSGESHWKYRSLLSFSLIIDI